MTTKEPRFAPVPDPADRPLLTADEVGVILGIGRTGVYGLLQRGELPGAQKVGGLWRVQTAVFRRAVLGMDVDSPPAA